MSRKLYRAKKSLKKYYLQIIRVSLKNIKHGIYYIRQQIIEHIDSLIKYNTNVMTLCSLSKFIKEIATRMNLTFNITS